MKNVFGYNDNLVSILKDGDTVTAITAKGETLTAPKSELVPAKLSRGGRYHQKFIQAALGGLFEAPHNATANKRIYNGRGGVIIADIVDKDFVRYAEGLSDEAFGPGASRLDDLKINKDKTKDYDRDKGKEYMDELSTLDAMDDGTEDAEEISISDEDTLGVIQSITISWENPMEDVSIGEIKELFGEGSVLPDPDSIKIDTGEEVLTRKKSWREMLAKRFPSKKAYYGPTPIAKRNCDECGFTLYIDPEVHRKEQKTVLVCSNEDCNKTYVYEGSLPDQGVAGQSNID